MNEHGLTSMGGFLYKKPKKCTNSTPNTHRHPDWQGDLHVAGGWLRQAGPSKAGGPMAAGHGRRGAGAVGGVLHCGHRQTGSQCQMSTDVEWRWTQWTSFTWDFCSSHIRRLKPERRKRRLGESSNSRGLMTSQENPTSSKASRSFANVRVRTSVACQFVCVGFSADDTLPRIHRIAT